MATRRNRSSTRRRRNIGLSRRRNTARRRITSARRRNGRSLRSNSAMLTLVMREGNMSRAKAKALKKTNYKKFRALYEKAGGETARKAHQASRGARFAAVSAKWGTKKKSTKSKSTRKGSAAKRSKGKRKLNRWDKFQMANKGKGWGPVKMSEMYQKKYGKTNPRRKNSRKSSYGRVRKNTARRSTYSRRKNTGRRSFSLRSNQGATGIMPIDATTKVVDSIPVVGGWVGPYVAPMAIGALSGGASFYLMRELGPKLPAKLQPYGYSLGGVLGGTVVAALPIGKVNARRLVAAGMVTVGAAIDLYRYLMGRSAEEAEASTGAEASADEALNGFGAWEYTGKGYAGLALDRQNPYAGLALDEGRQSNPYGAWEYTGQGALNGFGALELVENSGYGAYEYTGDGALNGYGAWGDYGDASFGDARYAPRYFSQHERHAARAGASAWRQYFGQSPRQMRRTRQAHSRHAGRPGHRWGWMIKLIGPEGMKQLAAMEPRQAVGVIDGLKAKALQALPELIQQAQSTDAEAMSLPPTEEIMSATNGVGGVDGAQGVGGFGSLLFTGNSF